MSDLTCEHAIKNAIGSLNLALKKETERAQTIQNLQKKNEALQMGERELSVQNQSLRIEITSEKAEIERLREENARLKYELTTQIERCVQEEAEHAKAKHVIKYLMKKLTKISSLSLSKDKEEINFFTH